MATEKETTAPIPSVAPDGEQPSALARTDSITAFGEPHKRFGKIQAMTMDSSQSFTPNWIVRTLNARQDTLLRKYDIRYVAHRTREGKSLSLRWDGVR